MPNAMLANASQAQTIEDAKTDILRAFCACYCDLMALKYRKGNRFRLPGCLSWVS